jgi:hypothetical protein
MRARGVLTATLLLTVAALVVGCSPGGRTSPGGEARRSHSRPRARATASASTPDQPAADRARSNRCGGRIAPTATGRFRAVRFVTASRGWVLSSDRILATGDGGDTWRTQFHAHAADLSSFDAVDATHAWAVGADLILHTSDGRHWTRLPEPCAPLRSVVFRNARDGVAVAGRATRGEAASGTAGTLLRTSDGGRHWQPVTAPPDVQSACFTSRNIGWVGAQGRLYFSSDAGRRWQPVRGSAVAPPTDPGVDTVQCAGSHRAWAEWDSRAGAMSQSPHVAFEVHNAMATPLFAEQYFRDRTARTRRSSPGSYPGPFAVIDGAVAEFVDWCPACTMSIPTTSGRELLVGTAPLSTATHGGGRLSKPTPVTPLSMATGATFTSADNGWVIGARSVNGPGRRTTRTSDLLVHTTDAGRTWTVQLHPIH